MKREFTAGETFMIFSGVPMIGVVAMVCGGQNFVEHYTGQKAGIYVCVGLVMIFYAVSMALSNLLPRKFIIPVGGIGWAISVLFILWFAWFGPGAFGHHSL